MAYTVLARRYRSGTFDEVVGQAHVAQTLKNAIASGRIAHAFLFCGTRGVGKTTMARILAKALNCEKSDKPTTEPCNQCPTCLAIARGDDIDVIEIDAASNRGIDEVRRIIENSRLSPARSRYKVYIIDEVHAMTKDAFNALLKVLEEPPAHVKFILATTEPEKVLQTILSRCQRYDFRNIPTREIAGHLANICQQEKIQAEPDALLLLAKAGAGSMRDALSLLDRLLSLGEQQLTVQMVEQFLGMPRAMLIFNLADAIGRADVKATLTQASDLVNGGLSPDSLLVALIDHLRNLLVLKTCGPASGLVEVPGIPPSDLATQADRFDAAALAQDITILEELRRQLRQTQAGRALLDASLVRLALADQFASVAQLLEQADAAPGSPAQKKKPEPAPVIPAAPPPAPIASPPAAPTPAAAALAPAPDDDDDLPRPGKVWDSTPRRSLSSMFAASKPAAAPPPPAATLPPVGDADTQALWRRVLDFVADTPALSAQLSYGRLDAIDDGQAIIRYSADHETVARMLERRKEQLRDLLTRAAGRPIGVRFEIDPPGACPASPAATAIPTPTARPQPRPAPQAPVAPLPSGIPLTPELRQELEKDSVIGGLIKNLGASIVKVE